MKQLEEVFLHTKPARMLVALHNGDADYASVLSREADCTYSHTVKLLDQFEEHGLVEFEKTGRKKIVTLTEDGADLAARMTDLFSSIEAADGEPPS